MNKFPINLLFFDLKKNCSQFIDLALTTYIEGGKDIDLLIVLKSEKNKPYLNINNYNKFLIKFSPLLNNIEKENNFEIVIFSSFRIQNYFCELFRKSYTKDFFKIHLLIYPSIENLFCWESRSVILSFISNFTHIIGDINKVSKLKNSIEEQEIEIRIQPLMNILYESYTNIFLWNNSSKDIDKIVTKDSLEKLNYVKRFILWELILEKTKNIPKSDFYSIINEAKDINDIKEFTLSLQKTFFMKFNTINHKQIKELYWSFFQLISYNKHLFRKG